MRQAITVTRHKNLWSSSSYSEAEKRGTVFKSAENTNKSHAKICYALYQTAQSEFFIIINTLRIYNSCSLSPLDQESIAKAILSCTTHSNTTGWQQARRRPLTAALFSLTSSAKGHYQQNSGQAGHQQHGQLPATEKSLGFGGTQKVNRSPEGISQCFLTNYLLRQMQRESKGKRNTSLSLPMCDENFTQIRQHASNFTVQLFLNV